ncbi:oligosaccharide flippase family protein [Enterovibrio sp. ZSDZ35]|uniref:Oligosaccharide flippase family protein n=1 Tax=Enterovibrio qingdaonensis TaxID=2899818 RepID=A0ABT5QSK1_9GAMM|nr:oligosaccharide flippase family protein [Enterovibrio sp. ZSDZ35]MDD1783947.1 oligosaccharide flippase family protein [Enterovibrio sp. ZSDZ35]
MKKMSSALNQTLLYGSSIALMKGISLLMLPFITHYLPQAEFGKLEIVSSIAALGSILVGLGLEDALYRFVGGCQDSKERKTMAARIFTLTVIVGAILAPLSWVLAAALDNHVPGGLTTYQIQLVLLMLALEGCIAVPLGWLRMQNHAVAFFSAAVGRALFQAALTVTFLLMGRGIEGVLEAGVIAAITQGIFLGYLQLRDTGFSFCRTVAKQSLIYSLPIMASGLMAFTLNGLDRWVLAEVATLEDVAQFGVAAKFALAVVLLLQPFGMWWMPKRFDVLYGENGHHQATRFTSYGLIAAMCIAIVVALSAPIAIDLLLPDSYQFAAQLTAVLVAAALFKEMAELVNLGTYAGKTSYAQLAISAISAVLAFITLWWWGKEFGVFGVLAALLFSQSVRFTLFYLVGQRVFRLPYSVGPLCALSGLCFLWLFISSLDIGFSARIVLVIAAPLSVCVAGQKFGLLPALPANLLRRGVA